MKISFLLICFSYNIATAKPEPLPETNEIIGSGIISVNQNRTFSTDANTMYYLDDQVIDFATFEIIGSGFKSAFTVLNDANSSMSSGTVNAIELITNIQGPVTSVVPLMVLEQPVLITSDTNQTLQNPVQLNQTLAVSGYLNSNNSLKATKLMDGLNDQWKIRGYLDNVDVDDFNIGTLLVNRGGELIQNCNNSLNNGQLVELQFAVDTNYQSGSAIDSLLSIECLNLNQLQGELSVLPSVVQGFITDTRGQDFWINDIKINTDKNTVYENGEQNFIDQAVNVEAQGSLNTQTSQMQADVIRFIDHRVEVTFPVNPSDVVIGQSISVHGLDFFKTPQSVDNSKVLSDGLTVPKKLQIKGYIDSQGIAYISKVINKGVANNSNISIRGDITSLNNPLFKMLNFDIDVSNALIVNQGSGVIDVTTFFNSIETGSQIEVKNAHYDPLSDSITNGNIFIRKAQSTAQAKKATFESKEIIGLGIIGGFATATISDTLTQVFISSFE